MFGYKVLRQLEGGGMGEVFQVLNPKLDRVEVLKTYPLLDNLKAQNLNPKLDRAEVLKTYPLHADQKAQNRLARQFELEVRHQAKMSHPNIAVVYHCACDTSSNRLFMTMEYVAGKSLEEKIGSLERPVCLRLISQVIAAIGHAHEKQVIHRDIKPGNLMLTPEGEVKLIDFGLASLQASRPDVMGFTPGYAPPEQVRGEPLDFTADIYALATTIHELLFGIMPPMRNARYVDVALPFLTPQAPALLKVFRCALAPYPSQRFENITLFKSALFAALKEEKEAAPPTYEKVLEQGIAELKKQINEIEEDLTSILDYERQQQYKGLQSRIRRELDRKVERLLEEQAYNKKRNG